MAPGKTEMTAQAFPQRAEFGSLLLRPLTIADCETLGPAIAAIPPWLTYGIPATNLTNVLKSSDAITRRYAVLRDGQLAATISIRHPWLKGPYVELLAVLPAYQRQGLGREIMAFVETEALRLNARSLWVCASQFNDAALAFYKRHGFEEIALLPHLVADDFTETLLRKMLT